MRATWSSWDHSAGWQCKELHQTELYQQITKEVNSDLAQRLERQRRLGVSYNYPADGCNEIVRETHRIPMGGTGFVTPVTTLQGRSTATQVDTPPAERGSG